MKRILIFLIASIVCSNQRTQAKDVQDPIKQTTQVPNVLPITDVPGTASTLSGLLKSKLALSDAQGPKVNGLLTDFLTAKSGILSLVKKNPTEYLNKFGEIQGKLFSGLKSILSSAQYTKFLGLKPKASDTGNLLSHLFF